ncbi:transposase [Streptomyces sp. CG1]|uniref:transposase n=1 Tax=Streptomyces sp. CG1 TaxID=1287523 RepID=UPI0034E1E01E
MRPTRLLFFDTRFADVGGDEEVGVEAVLQATRITLGLLAHRIGQLSERIRNVDARLARLVKCYAPAPQLPDVVGIGPDTAVALLVTVGDNPARLDSEASFAALCGVGPVERSSGRRQLRRLNRGGDRQANAALHRIVFTRLRVDPRTQDYYGRRIKEARPGGSADAGLSYVRILPVTPGNRRALSDDYARTARTQRPVGMAPCTAPPAHRFRRR